MKPKKHYEDGAFGHLEEGYPYQNDRHVSIGKDLEDFKEREKKAVRW